MLLIFKGSIKKHNIISKKDAKNEQMNEKGRGVEGSLDASLFFSRQTLTFKINLQEYI